MFYNRKINKSFGELLENQLDWLYILVKEYEELDFMIVSRDGKNDEIMVYRGLSRLLTIKQYKTKGKNFENGDLKFTADKAYIDMQPELYGIKRLNKDFSFEKNLLKELLIEVSKQSRFDKHYCAFDKNDKSKKEGYYQNELSRKYGILANEESEFLIIDKEAIIGYANNTEREEVFNSLQQPFIKLLKLLSESSSKCDNKGFGKNLEKKALGGELDFIALDKNGNILLIEYKNCLNSNGIYLSPIQIGFYEKLFVSLDREKFEIALKEMLQQKQCMGLLPKEWTIPEFSGNIIPWLVISNHNENSNYKNKLEEVLDIIRTKSDNNESFLQNLQVYNYTSENGLEKLKWQV